MRLAGLSAAIVVAFGIVVVSTMASAQEDCPRGTLDKLFCDRDGDLVADLPADPKKIVDPPTLIFSYTPVEDPAVYQKVWDGFIKHLEKTTGKRVDRTRRSMRPCVPDGCTSPVSMLAATQQP
jgi:phosphonate transport system substrate-binding protein